MARKFASILACRNGSSRLYGKPLQNLDVEQGVTVLEYMVRWMRTVPSYESIIFAIAEGLENQVFVEVADRLDVPYFVGEEDDVLARVIACAEKFGATDITRYTTESPFTCFELIDDAWSEHVEGGFQVSFLDNVPNGASFEILSLEALKVSHSRGNSWHRAMGVSLYIRENKEQFHIRHLPVPENVKRPELRLTIDYPEDLILCRAVYEALKEQAPRIPVADIISFLDDNPHLKELVDSYVEEGLKTMYL